MGGDGVDGVGLYGSVGFFIEIYETSCIEKGHEMQKW